MRRPIAVVAAKKGLFKLYADEVSTPDGTFPLEGVSASVSSDTGSRVTATRTGVFAFAAKKKTGSHFLTVDGPTFSSVGEVAAKRGANAHRFAARLNTQARSL